MTTRTFACRVSTLGQTVENQVRRSRQRASLWKSVHRYGDGVRFVRDRAAPRLERDDVLVVTKLDRLAATRSMFKRRSASWTTMGVRVHCLALGGVDLTSPAGKMTMGVIAAVAQFEKDLLIERTLSGQTRARARASASVASLSWMASSGRRHCRGSGRRSAPAPQTDRRQTSGR